MEIEKVIEEGPVVFSTIDLEVGKETNDYEIALSEHFGKSRTYVFLTRSAVVCLENKPSLIENSDVFDLVFDEFFGELTIECFNSLATNKKISTTTKKFLKEKAKNFNKEISESLKVFTNEKILMSMDIITDTETGVIFVFFADVIGNKGTEKQVFYSEVVV